MPSRGWRWWRSRLRLTVPWITFRLALRQDQIRWLREQRAQLYVDLLAEAHAEQKWLQYALADDGTRGAMREHFVATDTRLPPLERARLGARGTIFGSQTVNRLFNQMTGEIGRLSLNAERLDPDMLRMRARVVIGDIMDQLEAAIRRELGADR